MRPRPPSGPPDAPSDDGAGVTGNRAVDPAADPVEVAEEVTLRPRRLDEFVGQTELKEHLHIVLEAARRRAQPADHLLFAGPPGLGKPVALDSLVLLADGSRRPIGEIRAGDTVVSHAGRGARVMAVHDQGELACLRIRTDSGREVVAAGDHPFLTPAGWVKTADLGAGSRLTSVACPSIAGPGGDLPAARPPEQFRLTGYLLGAASRSPRHPLPGDDDPDVAADVAACLRRLGRAPTLAAVKPESGDAAEAQSPRVPEFVFRGAGEQVAHFLGGFFLRAGHISRRSRDVVEFFSPTRPVLADVQHLFLRLGVQTRLIAASAGWRLSVTNPVHAARLAAAAALVGRKAMRLSSWLPRPAGAAEPLLVDEVRQVEEVGMVPCRCLTVEGDSTYTVNDLVCHNTSLAGIVAAEMGVGLRVTSGPALVRAGDLAAILTDLHQGDVLFIDEIHRLARAVEEILYPAMEDFQLDIVLGKGPGARSIRLALPRFTLVGATTRTGMITGPLRDRFGFVARLDYYDRAELEAIVARAARILAVPLEAAGGTEIAGRARGTPRIANRLLKRVRDFAEVRGDGRVSLEAARQGLALFGVDDLGLDKVDRAILAAVCERFGGGPVGLSTLAVCVGEQPETIEDVYEPFLLQRGMLQRTPRGRVATPEAWQHLGLSGPSRPAGLFD